MTYFQIKRFDMETYAKTPMEQCVRKFPVLVRSDQTLFWYLKTKRHFKVRIWEYLSISHLTGKKVKIDNNKLTAIQ